MRTYLQLDASARMRLAEMGGQLPNADPDDCRQLLPVIPRSFRDFMRHEKHVINVAHGMVRRLLPRA